MRAFRKKREPEEKPAALLTTARIKLVAIEAAAARSSASTWFWPDPVAVFPMQNVS
jgi:hypothetical protein